MPFEPMREIYLEHDVPSLTLRLQEGSDGSLRFDATAWRFRTANDDAYEYEITVEAADIPTLRAALRIDAEADVFEAVRCRSREIVKHGESKWLKERGIAFDFFAWAPWATIDHEDDVP
jgi:hypothetical protein